MWHMSTTGPVRMFRVHVVLRELIEWWYSCSPALCPCLLNRPSHESMEHCCAGLPARGPQAEGINEYRTE